MVWHTRRWLRRIALVVVFLLCLYALYTLVSHSLAIEARSSDPVEPADPRAHVLPEDIEFVDSGGSIAKGPEGQRLATIGVELENTGESAVTLRVEYAVWAAEPDKKPWWTTDPDAWPTIVTILPGQTVGFGDYFEVSRDDLEQQSASGHIADVQVQAELFTDDTFAGKEAVGFSHQSAAAKDGDLTAEISAVETDPMAEGFDGPLDSDFEVANELEDEVVQPGIGMVFRDNNGAIAGGWVHRPFGEDPQLGKGTADKTNLTFPSGLSKHSASVTSPYEGKPSKDTIHLHVWP